MASILSRPQCVKGSLATDSVTPPTNVSFSLLEMYFIYVSCAVNTPQSKDFWIDID